MTLEVGLVLGIITSTMVLFAIEKIAPDVIALGIIVVLVLSGLLPIDRALAGIDSAPECYRLWRCETCYSYLKTLFLRSPGTRSKFPLGKPIASPIKRNWHLDLLNNHKKVLFNNIS